MGIPLRSQDYYDLSGGVDLRSSPTKVDERDASACLNVDYSVDGAVLTRNGSSIVNVTASLPAQIAGAPDTLFLADYPASSNATQVVAAGTKLYTGLTTPTVAVQGLDASKPVPDMEFFVTGDGEYLLYGNGVDTNLKYNGTVWTNLSLPAATAPTLADGGAGGALGAGNYYYYVAFARTVAGVVVQFGELSPVSAVQAIAANHKITVTIPVCSETLLTGVTAQCNARVLYRISPTSTGHAYETTVINDNTTTTYLDNTLADGTIEPDYDLEAPPKSAIIKSNDFGEVFFVDASSPTDVYASVAYQPWNVPEANIEILDGTVKCLKRCYGTMIAGTTHSLWVENGDFATADFRRISSKIGILNNRCAVGEAPLYIFATNRKVYSLTPTDFSQNEIRIDNALSLNIEVIFSRISPNSNDKVCMEYYTAPSLSKVVISAPVGGTENDTLIILNETQSQNQKRPCWQIWDNINAGALRQFNISEVINLYSGDYNGFIWKLDDSSLNGDGAEENGTVTSATGTTLTDTTKTWTVNAFVGMRCRILSGPGISEVATVVSNTATILTLDSTFSVTPTSVSTYTVGGYDVYHYTNWKKVLTSYDVLKQLWFIITNANASGDYSVTMVLQFDFDTTTTNQVEILVSLSTGNAIWGSVIWGDFIWGAFSVFQDRFRKSARFKAMRVAFSTREAGHPFQINGFSLTAQNKGLYYKAA